MEVKVGGELTLILAEKEEDQRQNNRHIAKRSESSCEDARVRRTHSMADITANQQLRESAHQCEVNEDHVTVGLEQPIQCLESNTHPKFGPKCLHHT